MEVKEKQSMITVQTTVNAPVEKVWKVWTTPEDIMQWNSASDDWYTPRATNDLRVGGTFFSRMAARDGSAGFDFAGIYDVVVPFQTIEYHFGEGEERREVKISFSVNGNQTTIVESFVPEHENSLEMQQQGWQAILNNFKKYTEGLK